MRNASTPTMLPTGGGVDEPIARSRALGFAWWLLGALGAVAAAGFAYAVSRRLPYPYEVEWMEGALADEAWRVANGLPIYHVPSIDHVPFLYPPLLAWLGGLAVRCGLDGLFALRLVAVLGTLGTAAAIGVYVARDVRHWLVGAVAAGIFVAGYGWLAWWYDLARNDMPSMACCLVAIAVLRFGGERRWLWAALAAWLAVLTKQTALPWLLAVGVGALGLDRRVAVRFLLTLAVGLLVVFGAMHVDSDGWSTFFVWVLPGRHEVVADRWFGYWLEDLLPVLPLGVATVAGLLVAWRRRRRGEAWFALATVGGAVATSWAGRLHMGGFDNVLLTAFCGLVVAGTTGAAALPWRRLGPLLLLAQFVWLGCVATRRDPASTLLPTPSHARAHAELAAFVAEQPGPVWVVAHGHVGTRAGRGAFAHGQAVLDVLQLLPRDGDGRLDFAAVVARERLAVLPPRQREAITSLLDTTIAALRERRFAAVVLEGMVAAVVSRIFGAGLAGADGQPGTADDSYRPRGTPLLSEPAALRSLVGITIHSPEAWVRSP